MSEEISPRSGMPLYFKKAKVNTKLQRLLMNANSTRLTPRVTVEYWMITVQVA